MSRKIVSSKHHLFQAVPDVNELCAPLFKETGITFFNYARAYNDGTVAGLFTHPEWLLHTLNKKVAPSHAEFRKFEHYVLFGTGLPSPTPIQKIKYSNSVVEFNKLLGFDYLLCINYQHDNYYEAFAFATKMNNPKIIEYYLNHLAELENFGLQFKDKADLLIKKASQPHNKIVRNDTHVSVYSGKASSGKIITAGDKIIQLSQREIECLAMVVKGRSAKETARILGISNRTVETHINNMKIKLGCHKKYQLIDLALENNID